MQIKLLKHTVVDCKHVKINDVVETEELTAKMLIGMGRAEVFSPAKPKSKRKSRNHNV